MSFSFLALILVIFKTNYFLTNETMIFNSGSYQRMAIIWGGKIYYVFQKFYKSALLTWGWGGSVVKNHPANAGDKEMQAWSLGLEYLLEEELVIHSRILAWGIPWTTEPVCCKRVTKSWTCLSDQAHMHIITSLKLTLMTN